MSVSFHEHARAELWEAYEYYEGKAPGLGQRFVDAVELAVQEVAEHPASAQVFRPANTDTPWRTKIVRRFPYVVLYMALNDGVAVVAVTSSLRRPRDFLERL